MASRPRTDNGGTAVAERLGDAQRAAQVVDRLLDRPAERDRHVAGQLTQGHHLQPPVPRLTGRLHRGPMVRQRRLVPHEHLPDPTPRHQQPSGQLRVRRARQRRGGLLGGGQCPVEQRVGVRRRERGQRRLTGEQERPGRPRPVAGRGRMLGHGLGPVLQQLGRPQVSATRVGSGVVS